MTTEYTIFTILMTIVMTLAMYSTYQMNRSGDNDEGIS